jgi:hypothetical protein
VARSSHGSRRTAPWAAAHKPRPIAPVVRLGRAANDNGGAAGLRARLLVIFLIAVVSAIALVSWL